MIPVNRNRAFSWVGFSLSYCCANISLSISRSIIRRFESQCTRILIGEMDDTCPLCTGEFVVNTKRITIRCSFCNYRFHTSCVRVDELALDFLSDNLLWFCDKCLVPIMDHRDAIVSVSNIENHLLQVGNLNEKVAILTRLVKAQQRLNDLQKDWIRSLRNVTRESSESVSKNITSIKQNKN